MMTLSLRRRVRRLVRRWRLGVRLVWLVVLLQGGVLLTLIITRPSWLWRQNHLLGLLWSWAHQPAFYPLVALLTAGPILSILAWRIKGNHRLWLLVAWAVFAVLIGLYYPQQVRMMLQSLQWALTY